MRVVSRRNTGDNTSPISMNATFNGAAFGLDHMTGYSVIARALETSATLGGTLKLQCSNNAFTNNVNNTEASDAIWVDISGSTQNVSGTGNFAWNVDAAFYKAMRVVWTRTSGEGTADIHIHAKGPQS